ncbi:MAG: hypothetical protein KJ667_05885, partial [Alphaproteobacteria bacterium]|nr:hypothetical protein [Alphaproteobacteria bacterium]
MSEVSGSGSATAIRKNTVTGESFVPTAEIMALWQAVHGGLRDEFGEAVFRSWLKPLTLQAYYHGTMEVSVPTRFMRDWIQTHYATRILEMCAAANADVRRLEIVVVQNAMQSESTVSPDDKKLKANVNN